jgi:hypothetical protein
MPTARPDLILKEFPSSIIVLGFGEDALKLLLESLIKDTDLSLVPNLCYWDEGVVYTQFRASDLSKIGLPRREFLKTIVETGGIVNAETSRNCHFAEKKSPCTFCVRDSRFKEKYSRSTIDRAINDLHAMTSLGVREVNYVDEEFFGFDYKFVKEFANQILLNKIKVRFLVSARVDSIVNPILFSEENYNLLSLLKEAGLRRFFVGLDSASQSQLKRYHKGIDLDLIYKTFTIIQKFGLDAEIGFVLFDPLVSISELRENIKFLKKTNLWTKVSSLTNMLRLSDGASYLFLLQKAEQKFDKKLIKNFDANLFEYEYLFLHPEVSKIAEVIRKWNFISYEILYALKSSTRGRFDVEPSLKSEFQISHFLHELRFVEFSLLDKLVSEKISTDKSANIILRDSRDNLFTHVRNLQIKIKQKEIEDKLHILERASERTLELLGMPIDYL